MPGKISFTRHMIYRTRLILRNDVPKFRLVKEWNDVWDAPHTYSSVRVIPLRWGWLAIYR